MAFNWPAFLRRHRIEFVTRGPSTSRDNVNVKCPLCGDADTGFHMGISLYGKGWHCWRNDTHAGRSRTRLIMLLLRCDQATAENLAGGGAPELPADESVRDRMRAKLLGEAPTKNRRLELLPEFKPIVRGMLRGNFHDYLHGRGYTASGIKWLNEIYDLHYASTGEFKQRIIVPIKDEWGRLQTWTARSIRKNETLRYRALGKLPTKTLPAGKCQPQETLLGLRWLWHVPDPKALLVVEGPFDAMWISYWGWSMGVYATCLFGLQLSQRQASLLDQLGERFAETYLMLDEAASTRAFKLAYASGVDLKRRKLQGSKDPAALTPTEATALCLSLL